MTRWQVQELMDLLILLHGYVEFDPGDRVGIEVRINIERLKVYAEELKEQGKP